MLVIFNRAAGSRRRRKLARAMRVLGNHAVLALTITDFPPPLHLRLP